MNKERELSFALTILLLSMLACNLPGASSNPSSSAAAPVDSSATAAGIDQATDAVTPTGTAIPETATPSAPAEVSLTKNSNCRMGPSTFYNIVDQIAEKKVLPVTGRNDDRTWWQVTSTSGRDCWISAENTDENTDFSGVPVVVAPALPGTPGQFIVINQLCQPGPKKFTVTLSWVSGGGETSFRLYRQGSQIFEIKAGKFTYKDASAPLNKNLTYELEAVNKYGTSDRALQIVPACK